MRWKYQQADFWKVSQKKRLVGHDLHRKSSKINQNLVKLAHLRTTHVNAETYINDEDAKEETTALLGEKFTTEIVQFIQQNLKSE